MLAVLAPLAAGGSDITSGAVFTLVFPIACLLVVLAVWFVVLRRRARGGF
ncbi:MAG: hypothetical protein WBP81_23630 [Solirubrobacteraceae bacterium]